jgi:hypothetical protein
VCTPVCDPNRNICAFAADWRIDAIGGGKNLPRRVKIRSVADTSDWRAIDGVGGTFGAGTRVKNTPRRERRAMRGRGPAGSVNGDGRETVGGDQKNCPLRVRSWSTRERRTRHPRR